MSEEGGIYLRTYLAPLAPWLDQPDITDVIVNRPGEVWFERDGASLMRAEAPEVTQAILQRLTQQIAAASHQGVNRAYPLLAATLPGGARVQIVAPPATRHDYALAIRKHVVSDMTLSAFEANGAFAETRRDQADHRAQADAALAALYQGGNFPAFLQLAVRLGRNIVISGGTATGKTTFLNALLKEAPYSDRIIIIEDTPEIHVAQPNAVGLVAVKGALGEARIGIDELLQASLRLRPDRLLVGEIRGAEAFTFLRAVNSGHTGSMTTVHADSPQGAFDQIAFMALQAGVSLSRADVIDYARNVVDIVVHLARVRGKRTVSEILFDPSR